jgi:predicted transposase YbfD/YdcC
MLLQASLTRIFPPLHTEYDKGHGRIETRSIRTSTALNDYLNFPYVGQVFKINRITTDLNGKLLNSETAYGLTSLSTKDADPKRLLKLNRDHWHIENKLHYVRDVVFNEDKSRIRKGNGAQVMAILRNMAINILRSVATDNIACKIKSIGWNKWELFKLVGLKLYGS